MRSTSSSAAERRVDSIRAALADRLLPPSSSSGSVGSSSSNRFRELSDSAVADVLAAEARRSKELSMVLGPKAFLVS